MTLPEGWFPEDDIAAYRELYEQVPQGGATAELGVWLGRSLCAVADIIKAKRITVVAVDTFGGNPGFEKDFMLPEGKDARESFLANIRKFGIEENIVLITGTTDHAATTPLPKFDLVFIDADHAYASVKRDIETWRPYVKPGGILGGDD